MAPKNAVVKGKQTQPTQKPQSREVAGKGPSGALAKKMAAKAGEGLSTDAADNLVPLIYVLQPLSPQVLKKNEAYIEDAEPGNIWLRNSEEPIHEEIVFQPCHFSKDWVEWIPRKQGGGFVGRYDEKPDDAEQYKDPERPRSLRFRMPSGNEIVETRYFAGFVLQENGAALPYIIPLSSTGHSFGKDLMFRLNNRRLNDGSKPPIWANTVTLKTRMRNNNAGEWYVFEVDEINWIETEEQFDAGEALNQAFATGAKQAEAPLSRDGEPADDDV